MSSVSARVDGFLTRQFTRPSITWRQAAAIVLPLMAEAVITNTLGLLNTRMISSSGVTSYAAVTLVDTLLAFMYVFYQGMATGGSVVVANYRGKGDQEMLHEASVQTVTSVTLFTVVTALIMVVFNVPMLKLLYGDAEADVMSKAQLYMLGNALSLPLAGYTTAICAVLRSIGEGKTSVRFILLTQIKYVALNILFLNVLQLEILGLVLSIAVSRALDIVILRIILRTNHSKFSARFREYFHINPGIFKSIMYVGMPCALEQLFFTGGRLVIQHNVVGMGTNAVSAYNVSYSLMALSQILVGAVNTSMYTISGICMGNHREQDVRDLTKNYFKLNTILYVFSIGALLVSFKWLMSFYNPPEEVIDTIFWCGLSITIVQPIIHNFGFMLPAVFKAVGDGNFCTIISLLVMWGVRVFGTWFLGVKLGMGVKGVWIAMIADWAARALVFPFRFHGKKWLQHSVVKD